VKRLVRPARKVVLRRSTTSVHGSQVTRGELGLSSLSDPETVKESGVRNENKSGNVCTFTHKSDEGTGNA